MTPAEGTPLLRFAQWVREQDHTCAECPEDPCLPCAARDAIKEELYPGHAAPTEGSR